MNRPVMWLLFIAVLAVGVATRAPRLGTRPMHTDEAVQAVKFGELLETGHYRYDPREYHGPTLYYAAVAWAHLRRVRTFERCDEILLRTVPLLFGLATLLWLIRISPPLRTSGLLSAGVWIATQPFLVFYNRYFIQESLLVFFTAASVGSLWRYLISPAPSRAIVTGAWFGAMLATKETAVLAWAALVPAILAAWASGVPPPWRTRGWLSFARDKLAGALAFLTVVVVFYSSFFTHWQGVPDIVRAFAYFAQRATGQGHEKPWWWYLQLLFAYRAGPLGIWSQWSLGVFSLVAIVTSMAPVRRARPDPHEPIQSDRPWKVFMAVWVLTLLAVYSAIPYKTPWLMMSPLWGMCVLAGFGLQSVWNLTLGHRRWPRWVALVTFLLGLADTARQNHWIQGRWMADPRNPCVYSHTSTDLLHAVRLVYDATQQVPTGRDTPIFVVAEEYWPLPWYLRAYRRVGYWSQLPPQWPEPPVIVLTNPSLMPAVESALGPGFTPSLFGLRPTVAVVVYVRNDIWERVLAQRAARRASPSPAPSSP